VSQNAKRRLKAISAVEPYKSPNFTWPVTSRHVTPRCAAHAFWAKEKVGSYRVVTCRVVLVVRHVFITCKQQRTQRKRKCDVQSLAANGSANVLLKKFVYFVWLVHYVKIFNLLLSPEKKTLSTRFRGKII